jgi:hypothetical protein
LNQETRVLSTPPLARMLAESLMIVASILLAFGIDAWWEERQNRREEQEILRGLKEEFGKNREILEGDITDHAATMQLLEQFLIAIENGAGSDTELLIDKVLSEMLRPGTTDLGQGAIDALLSSGRIELLSDKNLRTSIAAWNGVFDEVRDDQANNSKMVYEQFIPYFARNGVPASAAMSIWYQDWPVTPRSVSDDPAALARLLQDPEFRSLVEVRYGYKIHLTSEFENALSATMEILAKIDDSLD